MTNHNNQNIRNIAIIAHVDHGKTTLVDGLIKQTSEVRGLDQLKDLIMDNMDQERERGITIKAKNASIYYKDTKINLVDTPGHADFGGDVERGLGMVDGAILLVDAQEGPMPQTKFVLKKAIQQGLKIVVVLNKVDKPAADAKRALSKVEDLFLDLGANDDQMDFPIIYASGVQGKASKTPELSENLFPLLDTVLEFIPQSVQPTTDAYNNNSNPLQILVLALNYDNFKGKMGVGKITSGFISKNSSLMLIKEGDVQIKSRVSSLMVFDGLGLKEIDEAGLGEIVMFGGFAEVGIGDTLTTEDFATALPRVEVDAPTIQMTFGVNTSPFAGKEGTKTTSRQIKERLEKELETNVALRVVGHPSSSEKFIVSGRGELHLSVLIESMRREGFELEISKPEVIYQIKDGAQFEPFENVEIDVPLDFQGTIMQELGKRTADIKDMTPNDAGTEMHIEAVMPTRAIIGLKSFFINSTKGQTVMHTVYSHYGPKVKGLKLEENHGSLVSTETGTSMSYALDNAQMRGALFISPAVEVYQGMVFGACSKNEDLEINPCKGKQLTNVRSSGTDDAVNLTPPKKMTLENCLEYIADDELVEVTPLSLRIRKRYLDPNMRKKMKGSN
jgi:GTP-binding protein